METGDDDGKEQLGLAESTVELTEEQKAVIADNKERAKRRRLERYLEELEASVVESVETAPSVVTGGGFLVDDEEVPEADEIALMEEAQIIFPLEANDRCCVCGSYDLDDFIRRHYRVPVCSNCRAEHPDRFSLLTKTAARDEFLLTDEELRDEQRMPHLSRPNPLRPNWSNMQLFLREQVRAFALEKWGSAEATEAEAQRRVDAQHQLKERKFAANLKELRSRTRLAQPKSKGRPQAHKHSFREERNVKTGAVASICTECGFKVVSEEL